MTFFWLFFDVLILISIAVSVYWQSQITVRAKYNFSSLIYGMIFGVLLMMYPSPGLIWLVLVAGFILMNIISGVGGLTTNRIIGNGFFYPTIVRFSDLATITLTNQPMPGQRHLVIAIFTLKRGRNVRLNFGQSTEVLIDALRPNLPTEVSLVVR
ncbi:hypothetical protein [Loigolactobacillus iwatensis]|uniref:hypothetical protein n=1 Tax=Loigolactobacillus iwatensis TaxID=1267156 RepID=UPI000F7E707C|nr:hypothetical protein [Loigolactobacillus iwatensis]